MKKILYLFCACLLLASGACKKDAEIYKNKYFESPETPSYSDGEGYVLTGDLNSKTSTQTFWAKLHYNNSLIWARDSAYSCLYYRSQDVVLMEELYQPDSNFTSELFYHGENITAKASFSDDYLIYRFGRIGDNLYIMYFDKSQNKWGDMSRYGKYNLKNGTLDIQ